VATIDSTLGGVSANSYVTIAEADAYFDGDAVNFAAWDALDTDEKTRALITATRTINSLSFIGEIYTAEQALKWPRYYPPETDGQTIPEDIKIATYSTALGVHQSISDESAAKRATLRSQGVTSYRLGSLSETYSKLSGGDESALLNALPPLAQNRLNKWRKMTGQIDSGRRRRRGHNYPPFWFGR
jgi:hypothetical protein